MIVGCYSIHLYCDNEDAKHEYGAFPVEYTGSTEAKCYKQARRDGWSIRKGVAICPMCRTNKANNPEGEKW